MSRFERIEDAWDFLESIPKFSATGAKASNFDLSNIRDFCSAIGNPQNSFKSIHVAGTNGKGTTCHLLESIYSQARYKTGMFTSPHLIKYNERIRISGKEVSDETVLAFFKEVESLLIKIQLTYFEISTALAFWVFAQEKVDIAIVEVGLGGRLDSTNVIKPELSIITSIGLDHIEILGDSVEQIALEKAGIIKDNIPVVLGSVKGEPLKVIEKIVISRNSKMFNAMDLNPKWLSGKVVLKGKGEYSIGTLYEPINRWNIATGVLGVEVLQEKYPVNEDQIKEALRLFPGAPARFERLKAEKNWFFSGAHNHEAILSISETAKRFSSTGKTMVLSVLKDKINPEMLSVCKDFDQLYFFEQDGERAASINEIKNYLDVSLIDETNYKTLFNELNTKLVIFAGSFYFYPTVKRWLNNWTEKS